MEFRGKYKKGDCCLIFGVFKYKRRGIRFDSMWITFEEPIDFIFIVFFVLL